MATRNMFGDLALDTSVNAVKTSVDAVKSALDTGITVSLDSASLNALESTTVTLSGSVPLPTGASTNSKLDEVISSLSSLASNSIIQSVIDTLSTGVPVADNYGGTATHGASNRTTLQYTAILSGGSGYVVGEEITLSGGTFTEVAKVKVTAVSAGAITGVRVSKIGRYSATAATLTQTSSTGSGTGAQFTATWASNVLEMILTTGYNYFQFQFTGAWSGASTSIEGSLDNGVTWNNVQWYFGSYGNFSPAMGSTNSAVNLDIHYCPTPPPLIRVKDTGNNSIAWALRNAPVQTNLVKQGSNTGTNQFWYMKPIATVFGSIGTGSGVCAKIISTASTNSLLISSSGWATTLYALDLSNNGTTWAYLKIYNKSSAPTVGTDTPKLTLGIPPNGKLSPSISDLGMWLGTDNGFAIAITGGPANNDTTPIDANQVVGYIGIN